MDIDASRLVMRLYGCRVVAALLAAGTLAGQVRALALLVVLLRLLRLLLLLLGDHFRYLDCAGNHIWSSRRNSQRNDSRGGGNVHVLCDDLPA